MTKITSHATIPATVLESAFDGIDENIPVIVPTGTVEAHKAADGWSYFKNIQDGATGMGGIGAADIISIQGNDIVLGEAQQVAVYTVSGALVYQGFTNRITMDETGIYIVKIASGTMKAIIR